MKQQKNDAADAEAIVIAAQWRDALCRAQDCRAAKPGNPVSRSRTTCSPAHRTNQRASSLPSRVWTYRSSGHALDQTSHRDIGRDKQRFVSLDPRGICRVVATDCRADGTHQCPDREDQGAGSRGRYCRISHTCPRLLENAVTKGLTEDRTRSSVHWFRNFLPHARQRQKSQLIKSDRPWRGFLEVPSSTRPADAGNAGLDFSAIIRSL